MDSGTHSSISDIGTGLAIIEVERSKDALIDGVASMRVAAQQGTHLMEHMLKELFYETT
jgi:hypothetical protein